MSRCPAVSLGRPSAGSPRGLCPSPRNRGPQLHADHPRGRPPGRRTPLLERRKVKGPPLCTGRTLLFSQLLAAAVS